MAPESELARPRETLTATYVPLDPMLPKEGLHLRRWRLQLNVTSQELEKIRASQMIQTYTRAIVAECGSRCPKPPAMETGE
jgi:hypothetical protein